MCYVLIDDIGRTFRKSTRNKISSMNIMDNDLLNVRKVHSLKKKTP
jgi:hypothetical protein